jgi:hypothetical protein
MYELFVNKFSNELKLTSKSEILNSNSNHERPAFKIK